MSELPISQFISQWSDRPYRKYLKNLSPSIPAYNINESGTFKNKIYSSESVKWPRFFTEDDDFWDYVAILLYHNAHDPLDVRIMDGNTGKEVLDFILEAVWLALCLKKKEAYGFNILYFPENEEWAFSIFYYVSALIVHHSEPRCRSFCPNCKINFLHSPFDVQDSHCDCPNCEEAIEVQDPELCNPVSERLSRQIESEWRN